MDFGAVTVPVSVVINGNEVRFSINGGAVSVQTGAKVTSIILGQGNDNLKVEAFPDYAVCVRDTGGDDTYQFRLTEAQETITAADLFALTLGVDIIDAQGSRDQVLVEQASDAYPLHLNPGQITNGRESIDFKGIEGVTLCGDGAAFDPQTGLFSTYGGRVFLNTTALAGVVDLGAAELRLHGQAVDVKADVRAKSIILESVAAITVARNLTAAEEVRLVTSLGVAGAGTVKAALLWAQVQTGIVLNTEVQEARVRVAGPGDIRLIEADDVLLRELVVSDGAIEVVAGGSITTLNVASETDSEGNDVTLTSTGGNVLVDFIRVGRWHGAVIIKASGDIREIDACDSYIDVIGNCADLTAGGEIGSASDPELNLEMNLTESADENDLRDYVIGDIELNADVVGSVFITATGTITVTHLTSGAGEINLLSIDGDILVDYIDAGTGEIVLAATNGSIYEVEDFDEEADLIAAELLLSASTDISGGSDLNPYLEIEAGTLNAEAVHGSICLQETDDLEVGAVRAPAADVDILSGGLWHSQAGTIWAGQAIRLQASALTLENSPIRAAEQVVLQASEGAVWAGGDTLITTGLLEVEAQTGITLNMQAEELVAHNLGAGDIRVVEADDIVLRELIAADGMIEIVAAGTITARQTEVSVDDVGHDISLTATAGDILVGVLTVGKTYGSVLLDAPNGFILETAPADPEADVVGYFGRLNSLPTAGLPLDPELSLEFDLALLRNSSTDLVLNIVGDIELNAELMGLAEVTATGTITVTYLTTMGGYIKLNAGADILIDYLDAGAEGRIQLTAGGSILEVPASDADVDLIAGAAVLTAGNSVGDRLQTQRILETSLETLEAQALSGSILIHEADGIELTGNSAAAEEIEVAADGSILVTGNVEAAERVYLSATQAISAVTGATVAAAHLEAVAGAGIDLNTQVEEAILQVTGPGALRIAETDEILIGDAWTSDGSIEITAGGAITAGQIESRTGSDNNDIILSTIAGAILADGITAGALGDVLMSSGGALTATVAGEEFTAQAGGSITLTTTVAFLDVVTLAGGDVTIVETDEIVLNSILVADGAFMATAVGGIMAHHVELLTDADGNDISLTATASDIMADEILAGTLGDVQLVALGALVATVEADELIARANGPMNLATTVNRLDAETGAAGEITITEADSVALVNVRSLDGPISITAGEILAVFVQSLTDSDENDISLTTTSGSIEAGWISAGAEGDVTLRSAGAIMDGAGKIVADILLLEGSGPITVDTTVNILTAAHEGSLTVTETDGIAMTTTIASLTLITEESGDVAVSESDDLALLDIQVAGGIFSVSGGSLTIVGQISAREAIFTADDLISLSGSLISAETLEVTVLFGMILETDVDVLVARVTDVGDIEITEADAVTLEGVETFNGSIAITAGGTITAALVESLTDSDANDVALTTTRGHILIDSVQAGRSSGEIHLVSAGDIREVDLFDPDVDVRGRSAYAQAAGEFGSAADPNLELELDLGTLEFEGPDLILHQQGDLELIATAPGVIDVNAGGTIVATHLVSGRGAITLRAGADIRIDYVDAGVQNGVVHLTAAGSIHEVEPFDEAVDLIAREAHLFAGAHIGGGAEGNLYLETEVGTLTAAVGSSTIYVQETDDLVLASVAAPHGKIVIVAGGDITITGAVTTGTIAGTISLQAGGRIYLEGQDPVATHVLDVTANSGIFLRTQVATLEARVDGEGILEIRETDRIVLRNVTNADGAIRVIAGGSITALRVESLTDEQGSNVGLMALSGDILVDYVGVGSRYGQISLSSAGAIREWGAGDPGIDLRGALGILYAQGRIDKGLERSFQPIHQRGEKYALYEFDRGQKLNLCYLRGDVEIFLSLKNKVHIFATGTISVTYLDSHGHDVYLRSKQESISVEYLNAGPGPGDVKLEAHDSVCLAAQLYSGDVGQIIAGDDLSINARDRIEILGNVRAGGDIQMISRDGDIYIGGRVVAGGRFDARADGNLIISGSLEAGERPGSPCKKLLGR